MSAHGWSSLHCHRCPRTYGSRTEQDAPLQQAEQDAPRPLEWGQRKAAREAGRRRRHRCRHCGAVACPAHTVAWVVVHPCLPACCACPPPGRVDHVEPWMSGNARGVSTAFNLIFRLGQVRPGAGHARRRACPTQGMPFVGRAMSPPSTCDHVWHNAVAAPHWMSLPRPGPPPLFLDRPAAETRPARDPHDAGPQGLAIHPCGGSVAVLSTWLPGGEAAHMVGAAVPAPLLRASAGPEEQYWPWWGAACAAFPLSSAARLPARLTRGSPPRRAPSALLPPLAAELVVSTACPPFLPHRRWASCTCATCATPASCGAGTSSTCTTQR